MPRLQVETLEQALRKTAPSASRVCANWALVHFCRSPIHLYRQPLVMHFSMRLSLRTLCPLPTHALWTFVNTQRDCLFNFLHLRNDDYFCRLLVILKLSNELDGTDKAFVSFIKVLEGMFTFFHFSAPIFAYSFNISYHKLNISSILKSSN